MNKGIIWVKTPCDNYHRFVSKVQFLGISILEIKYEKKILYLKVSKRDFEKLQKYLVSYKFEYHSSLGIANILEKGKKNHIFLIMLLLGACLYIVLTNTIVSVNVVHENKEIRELLEEELRIRGVHVLSLKKSYKKIEEIKKEILDAYPDRLDWLEIERVGMVYNVRVEERIITNTDKVDKTCDIVAKKDGTISHIKLYDGEMKVDINDYVRKGDVLVSGSILHNEEVKRNICANAEVYANVWYTVDVSIPFIHNEYEKTGKKKYNLVWEINENKKQLFKDRFEEYESNYKTLLKVFDFTLFLDTEYETTKNELKYTESEALEKALSKAEESIKKQIGEKDQIINKKVLKKQVNDSTIDVEIFVIVEELISEEMLTIPNEEELKKDDTKHD